VIAQSRGISLITQENLLTKKGFFTLI